MTKVYGKSKLTFALIWIGCYVVLASLADSLSHILGVEKIITMPLLLAMSAMLFLWIAKGGLQDTLGLCRFKGMPSDFLWFIPLTVLITTNLWLGVTMNLPIPEALLYIASMLLVGYLEEVIFRGLLFNALAENSLKWAFIISPLTFGLGHIVNLLNGAALLPTLLQIVGAVAIGFLFTLLFYKGKSLWPCIITHGIFNSLSVFSVEPNETQRILSTAVICVIAGGYSLWLIWKLQQKKAPV